MSEESTGEHCSPVVRRAARENLHFITETLIISCNCCFYNTPNASNVVYYYKRSDCP